MADVTIHEACQRGDVEAVKAMIAADPACVDADDQYEWRPIFHAGLNKHEAVVQVLLEHGADVGAHDGYVMHYAGEVPGNDAVVRMLVANGALDAHVKPVNDLQRQFLCAVFIGDVKRVKALAGLHPELVRMVDGRGDEAIHHAARNGSLAIVEVLLAAGADVHALGSGGNTVLYCAAGHVHQEVARRLLEAGADPMAAVADGGLDMLAWLYQYPDHSGYAAIRKMLESRD